jgi:hypothetical protein
MSRQRHVPANFLNFIKVIIFHHRTEKQMMNSTAEIVWKVFGISSRRPYQQPTNSATKLYRNTPTVLFANTFPEDMPYFVAVYCMSIQ